MKNIKRKIENTPSDYLKGIFQESNILLSQRQPKNFLRLLSNSSISRNPSLPKEIYKCSGDKWCEICRLYLIECLEFELANKKHMDSKTNIPCRSRNIYYLKYNLCMYENYIEKFIGDHIHDFKTRMNNHIAESRSGVSTCKFPIHVFNCSQINKGQLEQLFFIYASCSS